MVKPYSGRSPVRVIAMLTVSVALAIAGASCGSSSSGGGNAATATVASSASPGIALAKERIAPLLVRPTSIGSYPPITKPIPKGKKIVILNCGTACTTLVTSAVEAATKLGWSVKTIVLGPSPADEVNGWQQAVELHPDAVLSSGISRSVFAQQLAELDKEGVPYFGCCTYESVPYKNHLVDVAGTYDYARRGRLMADWVLAHKGTAANTILVDASSFPADGEQDQTFKQEYESLCPKCKFTYLDVQSTDIGTTLPAKVVSAVQRDPGANYLVFGIGVMTEGVPQALRAAGLAQQVQAISQNPTLSDFQNIKNGDVEVAGLALDEHLLGWAMIDGAARHFAGEPLPQQAYAIQPTQFVTKSNLIDPGSDYTAVANYQGQFEKLWGLG